MPCTAPASAVLLDVVFNHTAEGGADGPVINFKGLANDIFYHLEPHDKRAIATTQAAAIPSTATIPWSPRSSCTASNTGWTSCGVDGFRFDLASVFARGERGELMADPPLPWAIESVEHPLARPLIAEAWDAAGLYQVGAFPGMALGGMERPLSRRDPSLRARRSRAHRRGCNPHRGQSSDLYEAGGRLPANGINFVTCHDGFTLSDLISYDAKHNEATVRTTATAATTTCHGTAASRATRAMRRY